MDVCIIFLVHLLLIIYSLLLFFNRFGDTREIVHSLTWQFLDQIGELTFSKKIQIPVQDRLYGFLGNYEDQGIYMVWLLHVLTSYV